MPKSARVARLHLLAAPASVRKALLGVAWSLPLAGLLLSSPASVNDRSARSAIEATIVISTLTTMVLLYRNFTDTRRLRELALLAALAAVAAVEAIFLGLALANSALVVERTGAKLACALIVTGALAWAAFMPDRKVGGPPRRLAMNAMLAAVAVVVLAEVLQTLTGASWASAGPELGSSGRAAHPLAQGVNLLAGVVLLSAAITLAKRWSRGDRQAGVLAVVSELLGLAAVQTLISPRTSGAEVTPADLFSLCVALLILAVAIREYGGPRRDIERRAISAERARLAQDLHDGLAQDLAFIASHSGRLASEFGRDHPLTIAARRALDASRGAIIDLTASSASSTLDALETVCRELERRYAISVVVRPSVADGSATEDFDVESREQLIRITREAVVNAVKHGRAERVDVELGSRSEERLLSVSDDGRGVGDNGPGSVHGLGLGLEMIRVRASELGARIVLRHHGRRRGTELLVLRSDVGNSGYAYDNWNSPPPQTGHSEVTEHRRDDRGAAAAPRLQRPAEGLTATEK